MDAIKHHSSRGDGGAVNIVGRECLRDHIGVYELVDAERSLKERGGEGRFARAVRAGEDDHTGPMLSRHGVYRAFTRSSVNLCTRFPSYVSVMYRLPFESTARLCAP